MRLRTSLGALRLVFFLYTSLKISPKLGYILYVCALARLISASSKRKNTLPCFSKVSYFGSSLSAKISKFRQIYLLASIISKSPSLSSQILFLSELYSKFSSTRCPFSPSAFVLKSSSLLVNLIDGLIT